MDENIIYVDFQASHNILIDKLMKYWLDKWTVRLTENWIAWLEGLR